MRFSLRFFLFSSLSFFVNGLSLALLIPNLITVSKWLEWRIKFLCSVSRWDILQTVFM